MLETSCHWHLVFPFLTIVRCQLVCISSSALGGQGKSYGKQTGRQGGGATPIPLGMLVSGAPSRDLYTQ